MPGRYVHQLRDALHHQPALTSQLESLVRDFQEVLQDNGYACARHTRPVYEGSPTSWIWGRSFDVTDPVTGCEREALVCTRLQDKDHLHELVLWFALEASAQVGLPAAWALHTKQTLWNFSDTPEPATVEQDALQFVRTLTYRDPELVAEQLEDLLGQLNTQLAH